MDVIDLICNETFPSKGPCRFFGGGYHTAFGSSLIPDQTYSIELDRL